MMKTSIGFVDIAVPRRLATDRLIEERVQASNVAVRASVRDQLLGLWTYAGTLAQLYARFWPWRLPAAYSGQTVRSFSIYGGVQFGAGGGGAIPRQYPTSPKTGGESNDLVLDALDLHRLRLGTSAAGANVSGDMPRAAGAMLLIANSIGISSAGLYAWSYTTDGQPAVMVATDLPYSSLGAAFIHPSYTATLNTTAGQSYLNSVIYPARHSGGVVRIETGADRGVYVVRYVDRTNSRTYLANLDGTVWTATASASVTVSYGARLAHMNETNVIPNGVGQVSFDGTFDPGESRTSYLLRLRFEKSGSPSPSDASQKGSYWFSTKPWLHGHGDQGAGSGATYVTRFDYGHLHMSGVGLAALSGGGSDGHNGVLNALSAAFDGSCQGMALDRANQRLWIVANKTATSGCLAFWTYKSPECFREVLSTGTTTDPVAGVNLGTSAPTAIDVGSDSTVYAACGAGGNTPSIVAVKTDLSGTQVKLSDIGLTGAVLSRVAVDRSRNRAGGANTVTTGSGGASLTASDGAFTAADVGRAIQVVGGADAGTYQIATRVSATQVTVQTLGGGAVSFVGQAATGTWSIGDRVYLFFNDATTSAGKLYYMESIAFGVILSVTVTMTNGANVGQVSGTPVDQSNGVLYWASSDGAQQVNRYDPAQAAPAGWSRRLLSDFNGANGGSGTISNPTVVNCVGLNPHASFRELWVGTDNGWVKLNPDSFAGAFSRYYGSGSDATPYKDSGGKERPDGSWASPNINTRNMRHVLFGVDGRVFGVAATGATNEVVNYVRDVDAWTTMHYEGYLHTDGNATYWNGYFISPYGEMVQMMPWNRGTTSSCPAMIWSLETHYQWTGSAWTPKEVVRGALPGTLSAGLTAKDLHTTLDDLLMGVKVKFTPQGGATPPNNEFLGRIGQTGPAKTDGATNGTGTFAGSGFVSTNVGDYLWLQTGADAGVYQITAFTNANTVTIKKLAGGTPGATAGGLTYSVWSMGTSTQPGPESVTAIAGHGIARDNTQDVTSIVFEAFLAKTAIGGPEAVKFAVYPPGPPKCPGLVVYSEWWSGFNSNEYRSNVPQGRGLPGALTGASLFLLDGAVKRPLDGSRGCPTFQTAVPVYWFGRTAAGGAAGFAAAVDLGTAVEVGSIVVRADHSGLANTKVQGGAVANLHSAPDGAAPVAAATVRTSGTGATIATQTVANSQSVANRTVTLSAGDFLGASKATGADGQTTGGLSRLGASVGAFASAVVGDAVKLTGGQDIGSYRITNVAGDGSYVDVQNLDQTAKAWVGSASGLAWDLRDAVREEDILSMAAGAVLLTVERLLTTTTAEVRIAPGATQTNVAWSALKPTWNLVKRFAFASGALPPDVEANGTYVSQGADDVPFQIGVGSYYTGTNTQVPGSKLVADLSDLPSAKRTGRYWKFSALARCPLTEASYTSVPANAISAPTLRSIEFYDLTGKLVTTCRYNKMDAVDAQPQFMAGFVSRLDWIQSSDAAASHVAGANGLVTVGGAYNDTLTLAGGNIFLGYEVRRGTSGSTAGGSPGTWLGGGGDPPFAAGDVGRVLRIGSGPDAGYYRIATVANATTLTVTTQSGAAVTFAADAGPTTWAIHEGVNTGDYMSVGGKESYILTLSDDFKTVTVADKGKLAGAGVTWEAHRPMYATTGTAGLVYSFVSYPQASGTVAQDHHGYLAFHPQDIQNEGVRSGGSTAAASAAFTGAKFTPDDVGRILVIVGGADQGRYEIATYVSPTQVTVKSLDDGSAISFAGDAGPRNYNVMGERRFRVMSYAAVLRS